jgi:hypothetical protein
MREILSRMFSNRLSARFMLGYGVASTFMYLTKSARERHGWAFWDWTVLELDYLDASITLAAFFIAAIAVNAFMVDFEKRKTAETTE